MTGQAPLKPVSPDCRDGNHSKCDGVAWDLEADAPADCLCVCFHGREEREQNPRRVTVTNWDSSTGRMEFTVDERTAAMIRRGQVYGFSIATDADLQPETFRIERTHPGQRLRPFAPVTRFFSDEQMEDWDPIVLRNPAGDEVFMGHQRRSASDRVRHALGLDLTPWQERIVDSLPVDPPAVDPVDVTWPDKTFKVFPDRMEYTLDVLAVAPDAPSIMERILAEVHHRRLEESILEELSAIITERGKDAAGILIIRTPSGEWAIRECEFLAPGSAVLSSFDQPDLMAVAQGDGWLYYRQEPSWGEQMGVPPEPEEIYLDILPEFPPGWPDRR